MTLLGYKDPATIRDPAFTRGPASTGGPASSRDPASIYFNCALDSAFIRSFTVLCLYIVDCLCLRSCRAGCPYAVCAGNGSTYLLRLDLSSMQEVTRRIS
jgi:hypothetical protein